MILGTWVKVRRLRARAVAPTNPRLRSPRPSGALPRPQLRVPRVHVAPRVWCHLLHTLAPSVSRHVAFASIHVLLNCSRFPGVRDFSSPLQPSTMCASTYPDFSLGELHASSSSGGAWPSHLQSRPFDSVVDHTRERGCLWERVTRTMRHVDEREDVPSAPNTAAVGPWTTSIPRRVIVSSPIRASACTRIVSVVLPAKPLYCSMKSAAPRTRLCASSADAVTSTKLL